jgi:hypothetical protein
VNLCRGDSQGTASGSWCPPATEYPTC